jgi:pilus assembly protein CpaC
MVGGEFGVSSAGNVGGTLDKIQYGMILKVKPTLQGRDTILSTVTVELSMPVPAGRNAYSLDKSETTTTVLCKVGESIVLSGLVQALSSGSKEKTPVVGDIPLLNLFFSEKTSSKNKKEVLVVLTPRLVLPDAATGPAFGEERKKLLTP